MSTGDIGKSEVADFLIFSPCVTIQARHSGVTGVARRGGAHVRAHPRGRGRGRTVQVTVLKSVLKAPMVQYLKLQYD